MRETTRRAQLTLEWTDAVRWKELPVGARLEVCGLLRELRRQAALSDPQLGPRPLVMSSEKILPEHVASPAFIYVRQSTVGQVRHHHESRGRQYDLADHARALGWH